MTSRLHERLGELAQGLAECPPFDRLSTSSRELLLRESKLACFDPKEALYTSGHRAEYLVLLLEGAIQIEYPKPPEERGRVIAMVRAPFMIGEAHVFHEQPWSGTGIAISPVVASLVRRDTIEKMIASESSFALSFVWELSYRFLQTLESRRRETIETSEGALAKYVVTFVELSGELSIPLQQAELGRATALSRETTNRILKRWADEGWITVGRHGLVVRSADDLRRLLDPAHAPLVLGHPNLERRKSSSD